MNRNADRTSSRFESPNRWNCKSSCNPKGAVTPVGVVSGVTKNRRSIFSLELWKRRRCLELQKKKERTVTSRAADGSAAKARRTPTGGACPHRNAERVAELSDLSLADVVDVEALVETGRRRGACPYYASRRSLADAQLIVAPYATLLHEATRRACGLRLTGAVVVFDEAHNLLDAVSGVHGARLTGAVLGRAHHQLVQYRQRYAGRLSPRNLLHVKQLAFLVGRLLNTLAAPSYVFFLFHLIRRTRQRKSHHHPLGVVTH